MGDEIQSLKHEIEVHFGHPQKPQVAESHEHPSGDSQKAQVAESHEHGREHKPELPSINIDREDAIQDEYSGLQHADLSSVSAKEVQVKENSKSVSQSTNEIMTTSASAEETHTVKETDTPVHDDSDDSDGKVQLQVHVQERSFQILSRGVTTPRVPSGSPGQTN